MKSNSLCFPYRASGKTFLFMCDNNQQMDLQLYMSFLINTYKFRSPSVPSSGCTVYCLKCNKNGRSAVKFQPVQQTCFHNDYCVYPVYHYCRESLGLYLNNGFLTYFFILYYKIFHYLTFLFTFYHD